MLQSLVFSDGVISKKKKMHVDQSCVFLESLWFSRFVSMLLNGIISFIARIVASCVTLSLSLRFVKENPQSNYPRDAAAPINQIERRARSAEKESAEKAEVFGEINTKHGCLLAARRSPPPGDILKHPIEKNSTSSASSLGSVVHCTPAGTMKRKILLRTAWSLRHCSDRSTLADAPVSPLQFSRG